MPILRDVDYFGIDWQQLGVAFSLIGFVLLIIGSAYALIGIGTIIEWATRRHRDPDDYSAPDPEPPAKPERKPYVPLWPHA